MADNKLNVEIGATTKGFEAGVKKAEKSLAGFEKATEKTNKKVNTFSKTTKANATPALQEFSRVIQDAPFGIQGVANNITQLTSQFGYLQKSAGGTKKALAAMLGTLTGPAGILLAVSAVTSLMVSYGDEMLELVGTSNKLQKAQAGYVAEAKAEISTLNQLVSIARDENNSKKVRDGAITELNSKYKKYLGNLDAESIKTDKVTQSVEALSKSLIIQAKIKGVADLITKREEESTGKILILEESRLKTQEKLALLQENANKSNLRRRQSLRKALEQINTELTELESNAAKSLNPLLKIQETLRKAGFGETPSAGGSGGGSGGGKSKREQLEVLGFPKVEDVSKYSKDMAKVLQQHFNPDNKKGVKLIDSEKILANMDEESKKIKEGLPDATAPITNGLLDFSAAASQIVTEGVKNTFAGIGSAIGESLVNGANVLEAAGGALLQGIGAIATELGKAAIAIGVGMISIKGAFSNPFTAIAAGVALVAIGSAIGAAASSTDAIGGGSGYSSAGVAGGGSSSNSYRGSNGGGGVASGGGTYVFEIQGTKLVGVLQNTLERNRSLGGVNQLSFSS